MSERYCIYCEHFQKSLIRAEDNLYARCTRSPEINPVDGSQALPFCDTERHSAGRCKPEGIHFREKKVSFPDHREYPEPTFTGDLDLAGRPLKAGT